MPLNGVALGNEIKAAIDTAVALTPSASEAQRIAIWQAIGLAITNHITANAVVAVISVSGVTTGVGISGAGAGTIT